MRAERNGDTVGNTVGSLSEEQHSIILGSLLGDGAMRCKTNALMEINHSVSQEGYVRWKYQRLANLVNTEPRIRTGNGGTSRNSIRNSESSGAHSLLPPVLWRR